MIKKLLFFFFFKSTKIDQENVCSVFVSYLTFQRNLQKKKADVKTQYQNTGLDGFNLFRPPVSQSAFGLSHIKTTTFTLQSVYHK